jgi:hypothetical protein
VARGSSCSLSWSSCSSWGLRSFFQIPLTTRETDTPGSLGVEMERDLEWDWDFARERLRKEEARSCHVTGSSISSMEGERVDSELGSWGVHVADKESESEGEGVGGGKRVAVDSRRGL